MTPRPLLLQTWKSRPATTRDYLAGAALIGVGILGMAAGVVTAGATAIPAATALATGATLILGGSGLMTAGIAKTAVLAATNDAGQADYAASVVKGVSGGGIVTETIDVVTNTTHASAFKTAFDVSLPVVGVAKATKRAELVVDGFSLAYEATKLSFDQAMKNPSDVEKSAEEIALEREREKIGAENKEKKRVADARARLDRAAKEAGHRAGRASMPTGFGEFRLRDVSDQPWTRSAIDRRPGVPGDWTVIA